MMKNATVGSRLKAFGLAAGLAAVLMVMGVPGSARASGPSLPNPVCSNSSEKSQLESGGIGGLGCSVATGPGGVWQVMQDNVENAFRGVQSYINGLNNTPNGTMVTRRGQGSAQQLAQFMDSRRDLAAGYTPTETTGQFIQRHLQPLRDWKVNAWFNTTWTTPRDTHRPTRYDSDVWTITAGLDMPILNESLLFGVFGSYTNSDTDTTFNKGKVEAELGTVGPYFVYTLNEYLSFDTTVGAIVGDQDNIIGPPPGVMGGPFRDVSGGQDVDGFFVALNANANYWMGNWGVQGRLGFLHSDTETESYDLGPQTAVPPAPSTTVRVPGTNNELTQIAVATQINYFHDGGLPFCDEVLAMPFFRVTWNYDLDHENIQLPFGVSQHPNDDDEVVLGWGVTLFGDGPFSGSVEAGKTFARSRYEAWTVSGTLSYAF